MSTSEVRWTCARCGRQARTRLQKPRGWRLLWGDVVLCDAHPAPVVRDGATEACAQPAVTKGGAEGGPGHPWRQLDRRGERA